MAEVTVHVNGKAYRVGCEDGEEGRLQVLAAMLDDRVRAADGGGALGETRLMLMAALTLADEAVGAAERLIALEAEVRRLSSQLEVADTRAAVALESAAKRIEAMAARAP
jgi:cell division protein ZapA